MSSRDFPDYKVASVWDLLVRDVKRLERRERNRRSSKWQCQQCPARDAMTIVGGGGGLGERIAKCRACGKMDRRLPRDRRRPDWTPRLDEVRGVSWLRVLGLVLVALAGVLLVVRTW